MRKSIVFCALMLATHAHAQELSKKTWRNDSRIVEVRTLYEATNKLHADKRFKVARKNAECGSWVSERSKFTDEQGVVRRYVTSGGSDDSAVTVEHVYDLNRQLRFAFVRAGAVNETVLELRFYFDAAGKLLWRDRRHRGPGYTWDEDDFLHQLVRSPNEAFDAAGCK